MTGETCAWKPEHDLQRDVPTGPSCGAPATHVIVWLDGTGRYSPCCATHSRDVDASAPAHRVLQVPENPRETPRQRG